MFSRLTLRSRPNTDSAKALPLDSVRATEASQVPPLASASDALVASPALETPRPTTLQHRVLGSTAQFCRHVTLPLPLALVVLVVYVHLSAHQGIWRQLNRAKGGADSMTWAPFWIAVGYVCCPSHMILHEARWC